MKPFKVIIFILLILFLSLHISTTPPPFTVLERLYLHKELSQIDLLHGIEPLTEDGMLRAVIEIPAGSTEKWEISKDGKAMNRKFKNGKPGTVNYLGYPANYGFIPKTIMMRAKGGDGNPLDVIVLGNALPRGKVVNVKPVGILKITDKGKQDDKLITIHSSSPFYTTINSINEMKEMYPGILAILQLWFEN